MNRATLTARRDRRIDGTATAASPHAAPTSRESPAPRFPEVTVIETARLAARVALLALAGALVVAAVVDVALAGEARAWLAYRFPGVPARLGVALWIFVHNARAIAGVFGLLLVAQIAARRPEGPDLARRVILACGELILAAVIAANVLVVGAGLGAYGWRMARGELPHGPVELAAYALALAVYLQGRRRPLPVRHLSTAVAASVGLLALAATLETFVNV